MTHGDNADNNNVIIHVGGGAVTSSHFGSQRWGPNKSEKANESRSRSSREHADDE